MERDVETSAEVDPAIATASVRDLLATIEIKRDGLDLATAENVAADTEFIDVQG